VSVLIPTDLLRALDELAKKRGVPRHALIRKALAEFVEREGDEVPNIKGAESAAAHRLPTNFQDEPKKIDCGSEEPRQY
jgi:predicted transcriptional regulator